MMRSLTVVWTWHFGLGLVFLAFGFVVSVLGLVTPGRVNILAFRAL